MSQPKFAVGQKVKIVRLLDTLTTKEFVGKVGVITDIETLPNGAFNYSVDTHYMHEEELEALD